MAKRKASENLVKIRAVYHDEDGKAQEEIIRVSESTYRQLMAQDSSALRHAARQINGILALRGGLEDQVTESDLNDFYRV